MKELSLDNSNFRFNPSKPTIFIYGQETEYRSSINSENQNQSLKDYYYENFKNEIFSNDNYNLIESFVITKKNTKKLIKIYNKEKKKFEIIFLSNLINRHYRKQWNSIKNNVSKQMRDFWEIHESDNSFN